MAHAAKTFRQIAANEKIWRADEEALRGQLRNLAARQRELFEERNQLGRAKRQRQDDAAEPTRLDPKTLQATPAGREAMREVNARFQARTDVIDAELEQIDQQAGALRARQETLPSRDRLAKSFPALDAELLDDAHSIASAIEANPALCQRLRPHYRHLVEAYEAEAVGKGLRDEKIIAFFNRHVHDSLADFGKDSTLPSDPRVIYVGANTKMMFANLAQGGESRAA